MTKSKKALSLILAIVMVFSVFAINVFAETETATFTVTTDATAETKVNDVITVTVSGTTNYYAGPTSVPISYDATKFELVGSVNDAIDFYGAGKATEKTYNTDTAGKVVTTFAPDANYIPQARILNNTVLFTFKLKVIAAGTSKIDVINDLKTGEELNKGKLYCGSCSEADINNSKITAYGQTINRVSADVTVGDGGSVPTPELKVIDGTTGVIDADNKYVYGIAISGDPNTYFEVTNGTLELVANSKGVTNGTGALLNVKNNSGEVVDSYKVVLFGDVDCDGKITVADYLIIKQYVNGKVATLADPIIFFAANSDHKTGISIADALLVKQRVNGKTNAFTQA